MITQWQNELMDAAQPERKEIFQRFFKTGKGEYGEGDIFIGLTVPANRSISKKYFDRPLDEISAMLASPVHEPLMRKATGWVLREAGKKDITALRRFLSDNIDRISSTTLSYATEKFTPAERAELRNMRNLRKNS